MSHSTTILKGKVSEKFMDYALNNQREMEIRRLNRRYEATPVLKGQNLIDFVNSLFEADNFSNKDKRELALKQLQKVSNHEST